MRATAVFLLLSCAHAQQIINVITVPQPAFHDLATTDDGGQTYFVSELRERGTQQSTRSKIFVYADGRSHLYRDAPRASQWFDVSGLPVPLAVGLPSVSGDGQMVAYNVQPGSCPSNIPCGIAGQIDTAAGPLNVVTFGSIRISGNKRYVLTRILNPTFTVVTGPVVPIPVTATVIDLATSKITVIAGNLAVLGPDIADDGSVVVQDENKNLLLWRDGKTAPVPAKFPAYFARVNRTRTKVAYESAADQIELHVVDLASGSDVRIATAGPSPFPGGIAHPGVSLPPVSSMLETFSKDGSLIAFRVSEDPLTFPKLFVAASDGSHRRKLLDEYVNDAVITGFGNYVYAASSRLVRIAVDSGTVTELIPPTPAIISTLALTLAPGGNVAVWGNALDKTKPPFIRIGDEPVFIVGSNDSQIRFLAPWDLRPDTMYRSELVSDSPFETSFDVFVRASMPEQFGTPVHENWTFINDTSPAKPGEIIHMSLIGLGAVVPPIELGSTAPPSPLHRTATPLRCTATDPSGTYTADVLFSGLMPGTNDDRYQVDLRLPSALTGPQARITCADTQVALLPVSR